MFPYRPVRTGLNFMPKQKTASEHGRQTQQGQESRKRLIEVTIQLICERGIHGTSVGAVCERAGVVKTGLYWHFGSKGGLLAAVIDEVAMLWVDEILADVLLTEAPRQRLDRMIAGLRDIVVNRAHALQVIQAVISESANVSDEVREAVRRLNQRSLDALMKGFGQSLGDDFPDLDMLATTIIALTHGALRQHQIDPENTDLDRMFADMRRTVLVLIFDRLQRMAGVDITKRGDAS